MKICPKGHENLDTSKFCQSCGDPLGESIPVNPPPAPPPSPRPAKWYTNLALITSIVGIAGGGLIILGWLTPWFSAGGILGNLIPTQLNPIHILSDIQLGIGNGLQLTLLLIAGAYAGFKTEGVGILLGLLLLVLVGVIVTIPVLAIMSIRDGLHIFELRLTKNPSSITYQTVSNGIQAMKGRAEKIFIIMVVIFVVAAIFPGGTALLGGGFYIILLATIATYITALYVQSQLRNQRSENVETFV
jgi:hypothetical protein